MRDYATTAAGVRPADRRRHAFRYAPGAQRLRRMLRPACPAGTDRVVGRAGWQSRQLYLQRAESALRTFPANFPRPGRTPGRLRRRPVAAHARALVTILGAWRLGAVYQPLFTAFGPKAIRTPRVATAGSKVLVRCGQPRQARRTRRSASGRHRRRTEGAGHPSRRFQLLGRAGALSGRIRTGSAQREDPFLMMFTSGTTGLAKPVPVPLKSDPRLRRLPARRWTCARGRLLEPRRSGLGLRPLLRCRRSLAMGHPTTFYEGPFSVESTCRIIRDYGITNLAGSPTAYRLLMAAGAARKLR